MRIVRAPSILTTPKRFADYLNVNTKRKRGDWQRDFFMFYSPQTVNQDESYQKLLAFFSANKANQRTRLIEAGIPAPKTTITGLRFEQGKTYLRRPLRHTGGSGYYLQSNLEHNPNTHYVQELFPKSHEYRIIFLFGKPEITLIKSNPEKRTSEQSWNHNVGCYFKTVQTLEKNRLRHSDVYEKLKAFPIINLAHICAVDILWNKNNRSYSVLEINSSPGISIQSNIEHLGNKIKEKFNLCH